MQNLQQPNEVKMKPTFLALLALCLCVPVVGAEKKKPLPKDFKSLKALAEKGDARAQYTLGRKYDLAQEVPEDDVEAVKWYRKSAEQGYAKAQRNLGLMYYAGEGVPQDDNEAMNWFRKSAEQGDADGQHSLGVMYSFGRGVPKDDKEAVKWYRKAAEQGVMAAQSNLGSHYASGRGVEKDFKEAMKWVRKGAMGGNAYAQFNLGAMYSNGDGVPEDYVAAYAWWNIAATDVELPEDLAKKNKGAITKKMTPNQIAEAQRLSRDLFRQIEANSASNPKQPDFPFAPRIDPRTGLPIWDKRKKK